MGQGTRWSRGAGSHGGHSSASLPPCPTFSTVPTGWEQMVSKLTGCKQLRGARRGIRYCLHAFSLGNKRCLPAKKKVCWEMSALLLLLGFFLKALSLSSDGSGLMSVQLYKLPAQNFFHFSSDFPFCSWEETWYRAHHPFFSSELQALPFWQKCLPSASYQACKHHELGTTQTSFFPAPQGLETALDASPKHTGQQSARQGTPITF